MGAKYLVYVRWHHDEDWLELHARRSFSDAVGDLSGYHRIEQTHALLLWSACTDEGLVIDSPHDSREERQLKIVK